MLYPRRYVCGPQPFWRDVQAALMAAGLPAGQLHAEHFGGGTAATTGGEQKSSGGGEKGGAAVPAVATTAAMVVVRAKGEEEGAEDSLPPIEEAYCIRVTLARSGKQFLWAPSSDGGKQQGGSSLLDAAEAAGADLPFGCREGQCGSCAARLVCGRAGYPAGGEGDDGMKAEAAANGEVLMCCAVPLAGARLEEAGEGGGPAVYQGPTFDA